MSIIIDADKRGKLLLFAETMVCDELYDKILHKYIDNRSVDRIGRCGDFIMCGFHWDDTIEGQRYWSSVNDLVNYNILNR